MDQLVVGCTSSHNVDPVHQSRRNSPRHWRRLFSALGLAMVVGLVPNESAHLTLAGAAGARTLTITPAADQHGTATITVMVDDGTTQASTSFTLTVTPAADPPSISAIADQALDQDESSAPLAFTITEEWKLRKPQIRSAFGIV